MLLRFVRHLRLHFQLVLAPVFLLGYALSGARIDAAFPVLFFALHIGLYGGATAYNSYYDRDRGPVGGMKHPPGVGDWERVGGLGLQWVALALLFFWGWEMGMAGLAMLFMGIAYSHPRWRWKARPWPSLLAVAFGQGLLPFLMGLRAGGGQIHSWQAVLTGLASALLISGLYPLSQVYQIEEDRERGDCTFAVRYGPEKVFLVARALGGAGLAVLAPVLVAGGVFRVGWIWSLPLAWASVWIGLGIWERRFYRQSAYQNHDWAFGLSAAAALAFWVFTAVEILS